MKSACKILYQILKFRAQVLDIPPYVVLEVRTRDEKIVSGQRSIRPKYRERITMPLLSCDSIAEYIFLRSIFFFRLVASSCNV